MKLSNESEAVTFASDVMQQSTGAHLNNIAWWGVQLQYYRGKHWRRHSADRHTISTRSLPTITDPSRRDVRVALNFIADNVTKVDSRITANEVPFDVLPASAAGTQARITAAIGEEYLRQTVQQQAFISKYMWCSFMRTIIGSHLLKLVFGQNDQGRYLGIEPVDPWHITLDPNNRLPDIANCHDFVIHSYALPVAVLKQRYDITIEPMATMGELQGSEEILTRATQLERPYAGDYMAKQPAVMIHELYTASEKGRFDRLWIMATGKDQGTGKLDRRVIWEGANPFAGLPFLKLDMFWRDSSAWGAGVPGRNISAQDIFNLSVTNLVRHLVHASWIRWTVPKETITQNTERQLNQNVMSSIIEYSVGIGGNAKPELVSAPNLPATATQLLNLVPQIGRRQVGLEDVSFGITSKRGEPTGAVKLKMQAADSVYNRVINLDAERMARFKQSIMTFPVVHKDYTGVQQVVGDQFSDSQIYEFLSIDPWKPSVVVSIVPGALLPKTATQIEEDTYKRLYAGLITPEMARITLFRKIGQAASSLEAAAFRTAQEENRLMLQGKPQLVLPWDIHGGHLPIHLEEYNRAVNRFKHPPEVLDLIGEHIQEHMTAQLAQELAYPPAEAPRAQVTQGAAAAGTRGQLGGGQGGGRSTAGGQASPEAEALKAEAAISQAAS